MKFVITAILSLLLFTSISFGQNIDRDTIAIDDSLTENKESINVYDKFNDLIGGDSIRYCNLRPCNEQVKDYHPNGNVKHVGFYIDGKLNRTYKNFYDNNQLERHFTAGTDTRKCEMVTYYKNGNMESKTEYFKGNPVESENYYNNGNLESKEKYDKDYEYFIFQNYYYPNGNPQKIMGITNEKNKTYQCKEFDENGVLEREGTIMFNKSLGDYKENGKWVVYDNKGKVIIEQYYQNGALVEEKKID